jgi:serine/threonine protein kinase
LTAQQHALLDRLFAEAVALPRPQQQTFLAENSSDPEVWAELGSLLAFDTTTPPVGVLEAIGETAASLSGTELIGQRLGPYRLTGKIGQGGMGTVYRAVRDDDQFQQTVAIKMLRFAQGDSAASQRFRRERQILATLEHPHVARLLDGGAWIPPGSAESQPYLVMEYVEGSPDR